MKKMFQLVNDIYHFSSLLQLMPKSQSVCHSQVFSFQVRQTRVRPLSTRVELLSSVDTQPYTKYQIRLLSWVDSQTYPKCQIRPERLAKSKQSSLFCRSTSDEENVLASQCYKTFFFITATGAKKLERFVIHKPILFKLDKWQQDHWIQNQSISLGQTPRLTQNVRLDRKGLPTTNTLAYFAEASVTKKKVLASQ